MKKAWTIIFSATISNKLSFLDFDFYNTKSNNYKRQPIINIDESFNPDSF
ncbi:hypothetical protein GCM10025857_53820 [Alicyclobacillus contaminans]|nr:hypothetical protein GCM10025857_53820 [Alicyclobacillus contaminans]